jgi:hypothetical protein
MIHPLETPHAFNLLGTKLGLLSIWIKHVHATQSPISSMLHMVMAHQFPTRENIQVKQCLCGVGLYNECIAISFSTQKSHFNNHQELLNLLFFSSRSSLTQSKMITPVKLIKMARKWQSLAALKRKRISLQRNHSNASTSSSNMPTVADKGHFVVYTADQRRFMFPISYLNNNIVRKLLVMSEEEFGLPGDGPITLPCDAVFMEYVCSLIQGRVDKEIEKAMLMSVISSRSCSLSSCPSQGQTRQQSLVYSFWSRVSHKFYNRE